MPFAARDAELPAASHIHRFTVPSPVGSITLFENNEAITDLVWSAGRTIRNARPTKLLAEAAAQLSAYFDGQPIDFDLPLAPEGSEFELRVWRALATIAWGRTATYGDIARQVTSAPRAVGRACGANPIPIIIPCHRILGAGGRLHGYSGRGGVMTKAALLRLEGTAPNV